MTQQTEGNEQMEQSLIDIAVESWRFSRLFGKVVSKLDAGESGRYINQIRYFQKKVEESLDSNGLKLVNVEGQPYDAGMAASALNLGDFGPTMCCSSSRCWSRSSWGRKGCANKAR
jgi:hypothetical protein